MGKRDSRVDELVRMLLDFNPAEIAPDDALRGWKEIAFVAGYSEDTLQRVTAELEITLPRWGRPGRTTPVFLPKVKVVILRRIVMADLTR